MSPDVAPLGRQRSSLAEPAAQSACLVPGEPTLPAVTTAVPGPKSQQLLKELSDIQVSPAAAILNLG